MLRKILIRATILLPMLFMFYLLVADKYLYYPQLHIRFTPGMVLGFYIAIYFMLYVLVPLGSEYHGTVIELCYNFLLIECMLLLSLAQYHIILVAVVLLCLLIFTTVIVNKVAEKALQSGAVVELESRIRVSTFTLTLCLGMLIPAFFSGICYQMRSPAYISRMTEGVKGTPGNWDNIESLLENATGLTVSMQEDNWKKLKTQERLDLLSDIAQLESRSLGMYSVPLKAECLESGVQGVYSLSDQTISIEISKLDSCTCREAVQILLHELYHVYQHTAISHVVVDRDYKKLLYTRQLMDWLISLDSNELSMSDSLSSANSPIEEDAKAFSETEIVYYEPYF